MAKLHRCSTRSTQHCDRERGHKAGRAGVERCEIPTHSRPFSPPIIWLAAHFFPISAVTWITMVMKRRIVMVSQDGVWREGQTIWGWAGNHKSGAAGWGGFIKMLRSASPLVDTVMNSQAHCKGKLLHYTTAQWSLISLGGRHPGGSPDQRIYLGLEVPVSLAIQSVQSLSLSFYPSLSLLLSSTST